MFYEALLASYKRTNTFLCVGLDPDWEMIPESFPRTKKGFLDYCMRIVDCIQDLACAIKINHAFFGALGFEEELEMIIRYIHKRYSGLPVILDSKRGDIGHTASKYADEAFKRYQADAVTVNPFLGWDTVEPFLSHSDRGVILLCRTSNPGSSWLQEDGVSEQIAKRVHEEKNPNLMLVVGATHLGALRQVRTIAPQTTLLAPGIGLQGGDTQSLLQVGRREDGLGLIVNCSRDITKQMFNQIDYFEKVRESAIDFSRALSTT